MTKTSDNPGVFYMCFIEVNPMNKTDTLPTKTIIYTLDKPYILRFTMKTIYELEQIYGSMRAAMDSFYHKDTGVAVQATVIYLSILLALDKKHIDELIGFETMMDARIKIPAALMASFSDVDDENDEEHKKASPYEPNDWDWLYFIARYKLQMSDDEFWDISPRRFDKLYYLWLVDNGVIKPEPEIFMGELNF